jgi:hypothetical protein
MGGANKQMVEPHFHDEFAEMPIKSWFLKKSVEKWRPRRHSRRRALARCEGGRSETQEISPGFVFIHLRKSVSSADKVFVKGIIPYINT